jgi:hypothetical protein
MCVALRVSGDPAVFPDNQKETTFSPSHTEPKIASRRGRGSGLFTVVLVSIWKKII